MLSPGIANPMPPPGNVWEAKEPLLFVPGRSGQENFLGELKLDFAFGYLPGPYLNRNTKVGIKAHA